MRCPSSWHGHFGRSAAAGADGRGDDPADHLQHAAGLPRAGVEQTLQGALGGLGIALLVYSLGRFFTLRETLSLKYALLAAGSIFFSLFQFGIGAQYLWRDWMWMEQHAGGLFSLMALCGSFPLHRACVTRLIGTRAATLCTRHTGQRFQPADARRRGGVAVLALAYALRSSTLA
ncbi:MAG: hypothetical protein KF891_06080 [Rhizobacter sp.]|nr:hypothetical protein [Rhizobacter sp.]